MSLAQLIAEAWAVERAKHTAGPATQHIDALCAKAVMEAMRANGLAVIEDRYMRDDEPPDLIEQELG